MMEMGGVLGTYFESRDSEKNEKFTLEDHTGRPSLSQSSNSVSIGFR